MEAGENTASFPVWNEKDRTPYEATLLQFCVKTVPRGERELSVRIRRDFRDGGNVGGFSLMHIYGGKPPSKPGKGAKGGTVTPSPEPDPEPEPTSTTDDSITIGTLGDRFRARFRDVGAKYFPLLQAEALPQISYNAKDFIFRLTLPPQTAIATDDPFLLRNILQLDLQRVPPGVKVTHSGTRIANEGPKTWTLLGAVVPLNSTTRDLLPSSVKAFQTVTKVDIELSPRTMMATGKTAGGDPRDISKALSEALEKCLTRLHLPIDLMRVGATSENHVKFTAPSIAATSKLQLTVTLPPELFLDAPEEITLTPGANYENDFSLESYGEDPLKDRYPIYLVCQSFGSAQSYVLGTGPLSILALVHEGPPCHVIPAARSVEFLKSYNLVLRLVDKYFEPIKLAKSAQIFLTFDLKPLVVVP